MTTIHCSNLTKRYGSRIKAVNGLNLSLDHETITGIVGRNGAGKTTFLKMLAGFLKPSDGSLTINDLKPFNNLFIAGNTTYIDYNMSFPSVMTLPEILDFGDQMYPNWDSKIANGLFNYFGFEEKSRHTELSKGRTSLFNAIFGLASRCPLTIFDEPTTGMDEATRRDFYRALLKDYLAAPRTILVSSHHLNEIEDLLEDVVVIDRGKIKLHESMASLEEWAFTITGPAEKVEGAAEAAGATILNKENVGPHLVKLAVRRTENLTPEHFFTNGFKIGSVTPTEVCRYLTAPQEGGIDHVYGSS